MKIVLKSFVLLGCFLCAMVGSNVMGCDIPPHQTEELAEFAKRHHRLGVGEAISVSFIRSSPTYMKDSWEYYCSYTFRARFKVKIAPSPNYHCENIIEITKDVTSPHGEDPTTFSYTVVPIEETSCSEV